MESAATRRTQLGQWRQAESIMVVKSVGFRDRVSCFLPYKIIYTGHERREDWGDEREEWEREIRGWGVNVATVLGLSTAFEAHHYVQWVRDNKIHWKRRKKKNLQRQRSENRGVCESCPELWTLSQLLPPFSGEPGLPLGRRLVSSFWQKNSSGGQLFYSGSLGCPH